MSIFENIKDRHFGTAVRSEFGPQGDSRLFKALVRLAKEKPKLRDDLLPVLKKFSADDKPYEKNLIELTCSDEALPGLTELLRELQFLGNVGSSRSIIIEDWDGKDKFDFDGDGQSKIGTLKVNGVKVK